MLLHVWYYRPLSDIEELFYCITKGFLTLYLVVGFLRHYYRHISKVHI
ncbi:hypothetical protein [Helicobacter cetorum]|nr:hypothetical protein [Helicobacter cetorum]